MKILVEVDGGIASLTRWCEEDDPEVTIIIFDHDITEAEPADFHALDQDNALSVADFDTYFNKMMDAHFENL